MFTVINLTNKKVVFGQVSEEEATAHKEYCDKRWPHCEYVVADLGNKGEGNIQQNIEEQRKEIKPPFYLVWNKLTGYTKYEHDSEEEAGIEANRLIKLNANCPFYVLKPVLYYENEMVNNCHRKRLSK